MNNKVAIILIHGRKMKSAIFINTSQGERSNLELPQQQEDPLKGIVDVESSKSLLLGVFFLELESFRFDTCDIYSASYSNQESVIVHQDQETLKGGNAKTNFFLHADYESFHFGQIKNSEKFPQHKT